MWRKTLTENEKDVRIFVKKFINIFLVYKWEDLILRCHIFRQRFDGQSCNHLRSLSFIYLQSSGKYVDCKPKLFNLFMKFSLFKSVQ